MQQQDDFYVGYDSENQKEKPLPGRFRKELLPKTNQENKTAPEFTEVTVIEIPLPGGDVAVRPVTEDDKRVYARQWELFQKQEDQTQLGTPITEWAAMDGQLAYHFLAKNIFTVEQLADASDGLLQTMGMGARQKREEARRFLARQGRTTEAEQQKAAAQEIAELKAALLEQQRMIAEMQAESRKAPSGSKAGKTQNA